MSLHYHIVSMHCDLVIECEQVDPIDAIDWWLSHEATEAVQMQIDCAGTPRAPGPSTIRPVVLTRRQQDPQTPPT